MKKQSLFKRYCCLVLLLVFITPILMIGGLLTYSKYIKKTPTYESHHSHTHYPVLTITNPSKTNLIQRGEYLAKIGNCISCHTNTRKKLPPFAGALLLDTPFGSIYSTNITPDNETGIGLWKESDFIMAMTKGLSPRGKHYFPAFPYPYFANLSKEDLHLLFLYLKAIPPIKHKNLANPFPFNLPFARHSMTIWNHFFMSRYRKTPLSLKTTSAISRGHYLVNGFGHCGLCHTPLNVFGAPEPSYQLSGRLIGGYWAPNITASGLKNINSADIINAFNNSSLLNNAGPLAGPMTEVTLNSLQYLTNNDKLAIALYLKTVKSQSRLSVTPNDHPPTLSRGKIIYQNVCSMCHQSGTMGAPRIGNGGGWLNRLKQSGLERFYKRTFKGFNNMPSMGACVNCSDNDIKSAVNYMVYQSIPYSKWRNLNKKD